MSDYVGGRDFEADLTIKLGDTPLKMVNSTTHMGIRLFNNRNLGNQAINCRISAAQSVILSARGIGSQEAPVPPTVLSHLYWSVGVPRMVYSLVRQQLTAAHRVAVSSHPCKFKRKAVSSIKQCVRNAVVARLSPVLSNMEQASRDA